MRFKLEIGARRRGPPGGWDGAVGEVNEGRAQRRTTRRSWRARSAGRGREPGGHAQRLECRQSHARAQPAEQAPAIEDGAARW